MELTNTQRGMLIAALKKELETEEKVYRTMADEDILDNFHRTGARTFDVALESDVRRVPIGTASVVQKDGAWEVTDLDEFRDGAEDAGLVEFRIQVDPYHVDAVSEALDAAGVRQWCQLEAKPVKDWWKQCTEINGQLVYNETGEPVKGATYVAGKTYTMLRPKSMTIIRQGVLALTGMTPMALLEGARNA